MRAIVLLLAISLSGCLSGGGGLFGGEGDHIPDRWPGREKATLYPGAPLYFDHGDVVTQCTAGFMFRSADNETLYLSFTSHCLHPEGSDLTVGAPVYRSLSGNAIGSVVYDGWADGPQRTDTDFALMEISNRKGVRDHAHPAVKEWDGPVGVADSQTALPMQRLFAFGASQQRGDDHSGLAMEGRLVTTLDGTTYARFDPHPIGGDSGGPMLSWDGKAFGLLHGGATVTVPALGGQEVDLYTPIDINLPAAREAVPGLQLVTWDYQAPATPFQAANGTGSSALPEPL